MDRSEKRVAPQNDAASEARAAPRQQLKKLALQTGVIYGPVSFSAARSISRNQSPTCQLQTLFVQLHLLSVRLDQERNALPCRAPERSYQRWTRSPTLLNSPCSAYRMIGRLSTRSPSVGTVNLPSIRTLPRLSQRRGGYATDTYQKPVWRFFRILRPSGTKQFVRLWSLWI